MAGRVFITQQPKPNRAGWTPNLSPAAQFGALIPVFAGGEQAYCDPGWAQDRAAAVLMDFNPEEDFILWPNTGDPIAAWACMFALARKGFPFINILNWERKLENGQRSTSEGFYTVVTFYFN